MSLFRFAGRRCLVDAGFGERRQLFVGGLFFCQRFVQTSHTSFSPSASAHAIAVPYAPIS